MGAWPDHASHTTRTSAAGLSSEQILADFPDLEPEDLSAALDYAAQEIDHPVLMG